MTITYDPQDPAYWDESDLRGEMTRVFDLCHGCRMCFKLCPSFPSLFEMVDEFDDQDAARLTPAQQDRVVDECFNCKLCYVICPYIPGQSEWELDFPRLMLRAEQVRHRNERQTLKQKLTTQALGRTDLAGKANTALAPLANKAIATPGSAPRRLMEKTVGIAAERLLPPYARQRFSTWFTKRRAAGTSVAPVPAARSQPVSPFIALAVEPAEAPAEPDSPFVLGGRYRLIERIGEHGGNGVLPKATVADRVEVGAGGALAADDLADAARRSFALIPFGGGSRSCIGEHFARLEASGSR